MTVSKQTTRGEVCARCKEKVLFLKLPMPWDVNFTGELGRIQLLSDIHTFFHKSKIVR